MRAADNRLHLVRFVTSTGQIRVTALGQHYFRNRRTTYVAHVPVLIRGRRPNGQPYTRGDHLPVTALGVGNIALNAATTSAQVGREVRQRVLSELRVRGGGEEIIMEISGEKFHLDPAGQWLIYSISTVMQGAAPRTEAMIRQPMAGFRSCAGCWGARFPTSARRLTLARRAGLAGSRRDSGGAA